MLGFLAAFVGISAAIMRSSHLLKFVITFLSSRARIPVTDDIQSYRIDFQNVGCTALDIVGEMMSAGFMFVSYDQLQHQPHFDEFLGKLCNPANQPTTCANLGILALMVSLLCMQVSNSNYN